MDYDIPTPLPDEAEYVERTVLMFNDPAFAFEPPPPSPVHFLEPPPSELLSLAPPAAPSGAHTLPTPMFVSLPDYVDVPAYVVAPPNSFIFNNAHKTPAMNATANASTKPDEKAMSSAASAPGTTGTNNLAGSYLPPSVETKNTLNDGRNPPPLPASPAAREVIKVPQSPAVSAPLWATLNPAAQEDIGEPPRPLLPAVSLLPLWATDYKTSANPSTVMPGDSSTITSVASSPQNRPLSYSYSASSGQIASSTATATLNTTGASPGTVTVTCNVVDDLGKQATANTTVTITAPPPPPPPQVRNLCSISFERDKKRPVRVDNEAKGCLDEIALALNRESSAKLIIVGKHSADETPDAAAQRDLNVAQYLTQEKGIDPSRIELRTGGDLTRSLDSILVPPGATFTPGDTNTFDTNSVKRQGQPYAMPKANTKPRRPSN